MTIARLSYCAAACSPHSGRRAAPAPEAAQARRPTGREGRPRLRPRRGKICKLSFIPKMQAWFKIACCKSKSVAYKIIIPTCLHFRNKVFKCFVARSNYCAHQVLNYLAALEPSELGPVAELFFAPLSRALKQPAGAAEAPSPDSFAEWRCAACWRGPVRRLRWTPGGCSVQRAVSIFHYAVR